MPVDATAAHEEGTRQDLLQEVTDAIAAAGVFDVHEHLVSTKQRAEQAPDLFDWIARSYLWADLVSAGLDREVLSEKETSAAQKWSTLEMVLPAVRHTGYMEVCRHAWSDLCGMGGRHLDQSNWQEVDAAIRAHNRSETFNHDVLSGRCGMRCALVDYQVGGTAIDFFTQREELDWYRYLLKVRPHRTETHIAQRTNVREIDLPYQFRVTKIDSLFYGWLPQAAAENFALLGVDTGRGRTLDAYAELIRQAIRACGERGTVGLKTAHNCCRSPAAGPVDHAAAEAALKRPMAALAPENLIAFENFALHEVVRNAGRYRLPLQIHTGTTYGPGGLSSARAGAADRLADLVQQHQGTQFVLMHASWPHWGELEQMAKRFPNLAMDLSWAFMLSPVESSRMLRSLLTSVPATKLLWGGDCVYVEESYGALRQAIDVVSRALARLIQDERMTRQEGVELAVRLFCTNGDIHYRLTPAATFCQRQAAPSGESRTSSPPSLRPRQMASTGLRMDGGMPRL